LDVGRKSKKGRVQSSSISWKDLHRLVGPWKEGNLGKDKFLSSEVIDALLQVMSRDNQQGRAIHTTAKIWAADPLYWTKVSKSTGIDLKEVERWDDHRKLITPGVSWDFLVIPINCATTEHWLVAIIDMGKRRLDLYDSGTRFNSVVKIGIRSSLWQWFRKINGIHSKGLPERKERGATEPLLWDTSEMRDTDWEREVHPTTAAAIKSCRQQTEDSEQHEKALKREGIDLQKSQEGWKWHGKGDESLGPVLQQEDGTECGVYLLIHVLWVTRGWKFDYTLGDIPNIRQWFLEVLIDGGLKEEEQKINAQHEDGFGVELLEGSQSQQEAGEVSGEGTTGLKTDQNRGERRNDVMEEAMETVDRGRGQEMQKTYKVNSREAGTNSVGEIEGKECLLRSIRRVQNFMFDMLCAQPVTGGERTRWDTDEFLERVREAEGYFMPDRTLGGKGRLPPQDCRCPTKEAKTDWRKRTCGRKAVMQQAAAASSFQVGIDTETGKAYTFFDSAEDFFKQTTYMVQRNFYEIVRTDQWCRLYFDVEHYTMTPKTNVTVEKILDIIEEVLQKRWVEGDHSRARFCLPSDQYLPGHRPEPMSLLVDPGAGTKFSLHCWGSNPGPLISGNALLMTVLLQQLCGARRTNQRGTTREHVFAGPLPSTSLIIDLNP
jgi:hypothetical protein